MQAILSYLKENCPEKICYAPMGDSISQGLFAENRKSGFVFKLADQLAMATGKKIKLRGLSEVGKTATDFGAPCLPMIIRQKPALVTIEFGTNDAFEGPTPTNLQLYRNSLKKIIESLKEKTDSQIILMTAWTNPKYPVTSSIIQFDQVCREVGAKLEVPVADLSDIWRNRSDVFGPAGRLIPDFSKWGGSDDFHPNQRGHQLIAEKLFKIIK